MVKTLRGGKVPKRSGETMLHMNSFPARSIALVSGLNNRNWNWMRSLKCHASGFSILYVIYYFELAFVASVFGLWVPVPTR